MGVADSDYSKGKAPEFLREIAAAIALKEILPAKGTYPLASLGKRPRQTILGPLLEVLDPCDIVRERITLRALVERRGKTPDLTPVSSLCRMAVAAGLLGDGYTARPALNPLDEILARLG